MRFVRTQYCPRRGTRSSLHQGSHQPKSSSVPLLLLGLSLSACSADTDLTFLAPVENAETDPENYASPPDGTEVVWYRGQKRVAERRGDILLIEGDIEVGPADILGETTVSPSGDVSDTIGTARQAVRIQGESFKWVGPVPYVFGTTNDLATNGTLAGAFSEADKTRILDAMDEWENATSGLSFVPRTTESDFITFNLSTLCSSPVARPRIVCITRLRIPWGCFISTPERTATPSLRSTGTSFSAATARRQAPPLARAAGCAQRRQPRPTADVRPLKWQVARVINSATSLRIRPGLTSDRTTTIP
jgi:hypothetical protein